MDAIKAEVLGTGKYKVLAIPFGGPLKGGKDTDFQYFSPRTDTKPHWFPERPVLFHHGKAELGDDDIGIEDDLEKGNEGWWARVWLDRQNRYFAKLDAMIRAGKMFGSSGTMGHLVKEARDGELLVWPHVEQTLTLTPANTFSVVTTSKAVGDFTSAGLEVPDFANLATELDSVTDLGPDLPRGGEDPAMARLAVQMKALEAQSRLL